MKKNDYLIVAATAAYSLLLYRQNAGINFLLFDLIFVSALLIRNPSLVKEAKWIWSALLVLISGAGIFIHSSALAIISNIFSLILISGVSFNRKTSVIFSLLFTVFSILSAIVFIPIDAVNRKRKSKDGDTSPSGYRITGAIVVLTLCILFFNMYKSANPLFADNTKWINLDFLTFEWLIFTFGGFLLVYPLFYHKTISFVESWENNIPLHNITIETVSEKNKSEIFLGALLFSALNIMLLLLNYGDISTIWLDAKLPEGISNSDFVHNGVGMLILSIVIALSLIMYLHRKNFSEAGNSGVLKALIYMWIAQNFVMLFSTAARNSMYIEIFDLTYKRIGVYVWLLLAAIGLAVLFVKVLREKSNWFLIRHNVALWLTALSLSSLISWDVLITKYNLSNKPLAQVDLYYLANLSDANIPELMEATKRQEFTREVNFKTGYIQRWEYAETFSVALRQKIYGYLRDYKRDWRSYDLRDKRILKSLNLN